MELVPSGTCGKLRKTNPKLYEIRSKDGKKCRQSEEQETMLG
jgi:hypothetical protein